MKKRVITETEDGGRTCYTGQIICRGPRRTALLLTEPYRMAGRIVEIPAEAVIDEIDLPPFDPDPARTAVAPAR
ncbi:MAG: hypothetical protein WCE80_14900 [Acidimicrobiia bacterium]